MTQVFHDRLAALLATVAAILILVIVIISQPDRRSAGEKWRDACIQNAGHQGLVATIKCDWSEVPKSLHSPL